jgi:hypothetical protein
MDRALSSVAYDLNTKIPLRISFFGKLKDLT